MRRWAASVDRFRTFSIPATLSALELIEIVKPLVPRINTPTLIIQGKLDTVIEPAGASWLHEHIGSTEKTIVGLPRTDHLVALDRDRGRPSPRSRHSSWSRDRDGRKAVRTLKFVT